MNFDSLVFSEYYDYGVVVMLDNVSSYLVSVSNKGLTRVSTICPQSYVDYDLDNTVKIIGIDVL